MARTTRAGVEPYAERRILETPLRQAPMGRTRDLSARQLPTNHDYAGGPNGSIREYQSDQPSSTAGSALARVVHQNEGKKANK